MTTIHAQTIDKTSPLVSNTCPVCHAPLRAGERAAICPTCKTPHHADCWVYNGNSCSQLGCNAKATVIGATPAPAYEPAVMSQTASAYVPPAAPSAPSAPAAPRSVNVALLGWLALIAAGLLVHWADSWEMAIIIGAVAVAIVAVLVEYFRLGGPTGLAPHVNVVCGLALGGLGLALLRLVWPYAVDLIPAITGLEYWLWVIVLTLSVFTGAWGGSTTLSPDSTGLVRRVAGLVIVYWAGGWLLARDFDPLWLFVGPALAAVVLVIIGLWDGQLVLDARRLGGALLGALTMAAIVFGLMLLVSEVNFFVELTAGWSFLNLDFTWLALLTVMVVFGASEGGASFTLGLWRFLGWLVVLAFILGTTYVGGIIGYGLAQDYLSSGLLWVGAAAGGLVGLVLGVMGYRVVRGLFK